MSTFDPFSPLKPAYTPAPETPGDRELRQLRAEVNELRERLALLEARPAPVPLDLMRFGRHPMDRAMPRDIVHRQTSSQAGS